MMEQKQWLIIKIVVTRCHILRLFDLDTLSRFGDIRNQSRTVQKIDRNCACFGPNILGE